MLAQSAPPRVPHCGRQSITMAPLVELYGTDHEALIHWITKTYGLGQGTAFQNPHRIRRQKVADRLDLYRDSAERLLCKAIDAVYDTEEMRQTMHQYVPF